VAFSGLSLRLRCGLVSVGSVGLDLLGVKLSDKAKEAFRNLLLTRFLLLVFHIHTLHRRRPHRTLQGG
jgi:hypothetical protein